MGEIIKVTGTYLYRTFIVGGCVMITTMLLRNFVHDLNGLDD